jgi:hypothetical protein
MDYFFSAAGAATFLRLYCIIALVMVGFVVVCCGVIEIVHRRLVARKARQLDADLTYFAEKLNQPVKADDHLAD